MNFSCVSLHHSRSTTLRCFLPQKNTSRILFLFLDLSASSALCSLCLLAALPADHALQLESSPRLCPGGLISARLQPRQDRQYVLLRCVTVDNAAHCILSFSHNHEKKWMLKSHMDTSIIFYLIISSPVLSLAKIYATMTLFPFLYSIKKLAKERKESVCFLFIQIFFPPLNLDLAKAK